MAFTFDPESLRDRIIAELIAADIELGSNAEEAWLAIAKGFGAADLWENVAIDPSVTGLNRPITTIVRQVEDLTSNDPITLWLKVGPLDTDWINLGTGGGNGDHEVKADATDTGHGSLYDKSTPGAGISIDVVTVNDIRRVRFTNTRAADDHLLFASTPDTSPGNLARKAIPGTNITITPEEDPAGGERLRLASPAFYPGPMLPNSGAGHSGEGMAGGDQVARGPHVHPEVPPAVVGSTFYPAYIPHPLRKPQARAILTNGATVFGFSTGAFVAVPGAPYTWQSATEGVTLYGESSGASPFPLNDGDYFGIAIDTPSQGTGPENPFFGLYRVIDCGFHLDGFNPVLTRATFVRADEWNQSSELQTGSFFQVTGENAQHQGSYFVLTNTGPITLDTTPLEFSVVSTVDAPPSYRLLTGPQLSTEGASNTTQTVSTTITNQAVAIEPVTPTLLGTPGLSEIPAGPFKVTARLRVSASSITSITQFFYRFFLRHSDGSLSASFLDVLSPPINNTTDQDYTFTGFLSAPVTCSPTDRIEAVPCFQTTSITPVTCHFTYQDPTRVTRIVVPFVSVAGSTTVPAGAITTGRLHTAMGEATLVESRLTMPNCNDCKVFGDVTGYFTGIATAGWSHGDHIYLSIHDPLTVVDGASVPAGFAPLRLATVRGVPQQIVWNPTAPNTYPTGNNGLIFRLRTDADFAASPMWELLAPPMAGVRTT